MKCTECSCNLNCEGYCQNIGNILADMDFHVPEPDGCPEMTEKLSMSEE